MRTAGPIDIHVTRVKQKIRPLIGPQLKGRVGGCNKYTKNQKIYILKRCLLTQLCLVRALDNNNE